ncbi:MAG: MFS transporter [Desulfovibrionaceae bacterium]
MPVIDEHAQAISYEDAPFSKIHRKVVLGGMLGQFSDGYILGIIGIAMSLAADTLGLTTFWQGLIGSASLVGLLFGSLLVGPLADRIGRKYIFYTTMAIFFGASVLQFFVTTPVELLWLRFALGAAIGADYAVGLTLVSEWTPRKLRGRVLSFLMLMWVSGYVSAYIIGYILQLFGDGAWRWILVSCAVPSLVGLYLRIGTPESPQWLMGKGKTEKALQLIHRFVGKEYGLPVRKEAPQSASWFSLFSPKWRRNTLVGSVFYACQVIPYFAIGTFLPRLLQSLNIQNPYASGIIFNVFLFIGVLLGMWLINKLPRRIFLIGSFYICAAALLLMSVWSDMPALYALAALSLFSFAISAASVLEFAYTPELFPTELRASGVGFVVAISRLGGAGGTFLLPLTMEVFNAQVALFGCVLALLIGGIVCHRYAPETRGIHID